MKYNRSYIDDIKTAINSIPDKEKLFGKAIFITGATGLVCSSVVDMLLMMNEEYDADIRIIAASRKRTSLTDRFGGFGMAGTDGNDRLNFLHYDASSKENIKYSGKVDLIIHGASNADPSISVKEPVETMIANIVGLERMLKFAAAKGAKILFVSSSEVYGIRSGDKLNAKENDRKNKLENFTEADMDPFKESDYGYLDILSERAGYPSSKRAGESLCIAYAMEYGIYPVIVRPGHIYGPVIKGTDSRATAEFTRNAAAGQDIIMRSRGTQLRSYCYSLDCASGMLTALTEGEKCNAYNISNPESICTISDIARAIAEYSGIEVKYAEVKEDQKKFSPMTNSSLDSSKLMALGWKPAFDLKRGVKSLLDAYR